MLLVQVIHAANHRPAQHFVHVKVRQLQGGVLPLQAGEAEQVVDELAQSLGFVPHDVQVLAVVLGWDGAILHALHKAADAGNGAAQLMGHIGHKLPPGAFQLAELFSHGVEAVRQARHFRRRAADLHPGVKLPLGHAPRRVRHDAQGAYQAPGIEKYQQRRQERRSAPHQDNRLQKVAGAALNGLGLGLNQHRTQHLIVLDKGDPHGKGGRAVHHGAHGDFLPAQHLVQRLVQLLLVQGGHKGRVLHISRLQVAHQLPTAVQHQNVRAKILVHAGGFPVEVSLGGIFNAQQQVGCGYGILGRQIGNFLGFLFQLLQAVINLQVAHGGIGQKAHRRQRQDQYRHKHGEEPGEHGLLAPINAFQTYTPHPTPCGSSSRTFRSPAASPAGA